MPFTIGSAFVKRQTATVRPIPNTKFGFTSLLVRAPQAPLMFPTKTPPFNAARYLLPPGQVGTILMTALANKSSSMVITLGRTRLMKTWSKPVVATVDAGFEVTRYLPSTLDVAAKRACTK
jgi:coenzyme PQQ precursor peptide PqqA